MILQGTADKDAKFIARASDGCFVVSGTLSAFFGYKVISDQNRGGIWAEWLWQDGRFKFENDRYGFWPLYYFNTKNSFGISPSISELLKNGASRELDDAAISVFLRLGFFIGSDTPFKEIYAIPPGCTISLENERFHVKAGDMPFTGKAISISRDDATKVYGDLVQSVIGKYLFNDKAKIALPLSGGRDSRHILFALLRSGRKPYECITVKYIPPMNDRDAYIASIISSRLGLKHTVLESVPNVFRSELRKNLLTNFCADEHTWILPLADYIKRNAFTHLLDGIGGDVLSNGLFLNEHKLRLYQTGKLDELAELLLGPEEWNLQRILLPKFYKIWNRELARTHLKAELMKFSSAINPISQFYFWNRTRREIALQPWAILADPALVLAPYLNNEVYDFLSALPAEYFLGHNFHDEAIKSSFPEYSDLPFGDKIDRKRRESGVLNTTKFVYNFLKYCLSSYDEKSGASLLYSLPRAIRGLVNSKYGTGLPELLNKTIYLMQLAAYADELG